MATSIQSVIQNATKFFAGTKRGEIPEWKQELNNEKESVRKEAVKKVIAAMTVGKDVSMLFPDVVKCISTQNIELKKLVYLYIMNYAKTQPELAILAVNTFVKDSQHANPLVRALAVRTMGCIRVDKITEYLAEPLRASLKDPDPYVRKTGAVAVAKLYDLNRDLVVELGFLDSLKELLSDSTPMVVANAVAAVSEIAETSKDVVLELDKRTVNTLIVALNECTEWGQVFILDALSKYTPADSKEAEVTAERIIPRLQHANSAVVLSAVKVILRMMQLIRNEQTITGLCRKMAGPLVTLLNTEPEIQYVALRNIDLVVQKIPGILSNEIKVFFCKYNDPIYVKMEKLEVMIKLVNERNIDTVLMEFKEYATEIDVEFVRKSVRAIGRCAVKLERAAQRCIDVLLDLIQTKVNYVVQEAIIVIKDIFRKYPNRYEMIIGTLCENLETLDEPEAKASMIWIIGEYAERIENAGELLEVFIDTFNDETNQVQLQLLTATVKLFLKRPSESQALVQKVLQLATEGSDNPDLRDRGYVYWRLLSSDPEAAKAVVLSEKPVINDDTSNLAPNLLEELINNIATLSSVYHKPPEMFVPEYNAASKAKAIQHDDDDDDYGYSHSAEAETSPSSSGAAGGASVADILDFTGMGLGSTSAGIQPGDVAAQQSAAAASLSFDDLMGSTKSTTSGKVLLPAASGQGLQISGQIARRNGAIVYELNFTNNSAAQVGGFAIQFNKNTFALAPAAPLQVPTLNPGQSADVALPLGTNGKLADNFSSDLQIAVKSSLGVFYFKDTIPFSALLTESGRLEKEEFLAIWKSIADENESRIDITGLTINSAEGIKKKLEAYNIFFIAKRTLQGQENLYFSLKLPVNDTIIVMELVLFQGTNNCRVSSKSATIGYLGLFEDELTSILTN